MIHARKTWLALAALALLVAPAVSAPAPFNKVAGADSDKWLLNDAEAILVINVKQIRSAKMVKDSEATIKAMLKGNEQYKALTAAIGADPMKDVDNLLLSATGSSAKDAKFLMVVRGKFDQQKAHKALEKMAKDKPDELKLV